MAIVMDPASPTFDDPDELAHALDRLEAEVDGVQPATLRHPIGEMSDEVISGGPDVTQIWPRTSHGEFVRAGAMLDASDDAWAREMYGTNMTPARARGRNAAISREGYIPTNTASARRTNGVWSGSFGGPPPRSEASPTMDMFLDDEPAERAPPAEPAAEYAPQWRLSDGPFVLPQDPLEVLRVNDGHRGGESKTDLWSLEQAHAVLPRAYAFRAPTFTPRRWAAAKPLTQQVYDARFAESLPLVAPCLPISNVVVAGNGAARCLVEPDASGMSLDFYIVGIDPEDKRALWLKVGEIVNRLRAVGMTAEYPDPHGPAGLRVHPVLGSGRQPYGGQGAYLYSGSGAQPQEYPQMITSLLMPGAVKLMAETGEIRIILRAFASLSELLHGFDVPAACVAYDGVTTVMTTLGAYAHTARANIVNPAYHNSTYAAQLAWWFARGYALAMPHLRPSALEKGASLALPHLTLAAAVVRGCFAVGTVTPADPNPVWDDFVERKTVDGIFTGGRHRSCDPGPRCNLREFACATERYTLMRSAIIGGEGYDVRNRNRGHAFDEYAAVEPTFVDVFPAELFRATLDEATADAITTGGCVNTELLATVLCLSSEEISRAVVAVTRAGRAHPGQPIDSAASLAPFKAALADRYAARAAAPAIEWWTRRTAPLVTREPQPQTPAEWYGAHVADAEVQDPLVIASLLGHIEAGQAGDGVHDGECSLCHEALLRGAPNSLLLGCGHIFHWSGADCPGFVGWVTGGHGDCPVCRASFRGEPRVEAAAPPTSAPVLVRW
ncbi:MAG: RING-H2 finger protein [Pseudomonadota bacterium]